jgi:hypothetical protein
MSTHLEKSIALATKISAKAEETLAGIEREMHIMKWPNEYRAIMWEAISDAAKARASSVSLQDRGGK